MVAVRAAVTLANSIVEADPPGTCHQRSRRVEGLHMERAGPRLIVIAGARSQLEGADPL
jgi:hypothetical protein